MIELLAQVATATESTDQFLIWGFLLFGVAFVLLLVELFVPSGGLIGVLSGIAVIGSIVCFFRVSPTFGAASIGAYLVLTPITLVFVFKVWLRSGWGRSMILGGAVEPQDVIEDEARDSAERARRSRMEELRQLIGAEGVTVSGLRPVGFVKIAGQRVDALAESGTIEPNTPVTVVDVYDNQIKVRPSG